MILFFSTDVGKAVYPSLHCSHVHVKCKYVGTEVGEQGQGFRLV